MPKTVAGTLTNVLNHPVMKTVQDRTQSIEEVVKKITPWWTMDLYTRKPGPAIWDEDGKFQPTDLDLATFLYALAEREAVINLPVYKGMRASTVRDNERVISKDNRHGQLLGLTSNAQVFSFSAKVKDFNVVQKDSATGKETVGAVRNFCLINPMGEWHDGWRTITFDPSAKENAFLKDNSLWTGNKVIFSNFVHPNRWISFYGQYYFITKALLQRLEEQSKFLQTEIKRLQEEGVRYPESGEGAEKEWGTTTKVGDEKSVTVNAFEVEIDLPEANGEYTKLENTTQALVAATALRKSMIYHWAPMLRFAVRSVEFAFYKHGRPEGQEKMPPWITDANWERDYVIKGKRNRWSRLVLFQPAPGQTGVSIRYRIWDKVEKLADN